MAGAQAIERLARSIGALGGQITALPAPENDRMTSAIGRRPKRSLDFSIATSG